MAKSQAQIINLASIKDNPLRGENLKNELLSTADSIALLQAYANLVSQQAIVGPACVWALCGTLPLHKEPNALLIKRNSL